MSVFFFKQKTAYEMRISDWSSDVCSSDLALKLANAWESGGTETESRRSGQEVMSQEDATKLVDLLEAPVVQTPESAKQAGLKVKQIGRASCRERVCQYV